MKTQYTPGPWEWVPGTCYVWAKDSYEPKIGKNMMVAMANDSEWSDVPAPEGKMTVATARGWGRLQHLGSKNAEAIQDANARLIAAAPELLEAVEIAIAHIKTGCNLLRDQDIVFIETAIAKAKGEK